ncbi:MAG: histidine phosphatase family protein [Pseudomonadota bacterium]
MTAQSDGPDAMPLLLLRHAKSSWDQPEPDHARPLNARGRRDAPVMARRLHGLGFAPARVLCSPARRTRETYEGMAPHWPLPPPVFLSTLYETGADALSAVLAEFGSSGTLLIGHNPGLQDLTARLVDGPPVARFPTGAAAVIDPRKRALLAFLTPKDDPGPR